MSPGNKLKEADHQSKSLFDLTFDWTVTDIRLIVGAFGGQVTPPIPKMSLGPRSTSIPMVLWVRMKVGISKSPKRAYSMGARRFLTQHAPLSICPISKEGGRKGEGILKSYIKTIH